SLQNRFRFPIEACDAQVVYWLSRLRVITKAINKPTCIQLRQDVTLLLSFPFVERIEFLHRLVVSSHHVHGSYLSLQALRVSLRKFQLNLLDCLSFDRSISDIQRALTEFHQSFYGAGGSAKCCSWHAEILPCCDFEIGREK